MNVFRIAADSSHLLAIFILLLKIWKTRSCAGSECPDNRFRCPTGRCISTSWFCDKANDCGDNSDEKFCGNLCQEGYYRCPTQKCISTSWFCDGNNDCGDNSDEAFCDNLCPKGYYRCPTRKCISTSWFCDGNNDCGDNSDEAFCGNLCPEGYYRCPTQKCISTSWFCDGNNDCGDNSDEAFCGNLCPAGYYRCPTQKCIRTSWLCDGNNDCGDNSDEAFCGHLCPEGYYRCPTQKCISTSWFCDGNNDCGDNSDEAFCDYLCPQGYYRCPTRKCISTSWFCDGNNDCGDNSDEAFCRNLCPEGYYRCPTQKCISTSWFCDGNNDCGDNSDEAFCGNLNLNVQYSISRIRSVKTSWFCDRYDRCEEGSGKEICGNQCPVGQFRCPTGRCVTTSLFCDRNDDCGDGSDEAFCGKLCPKDYYRCPNGRCISTSLFCDGNDDCGDNSDEVFCGNLCPKDHFRCPTGRCITKSLFCDKNDDCGDGSDEEFCGKLCPVGRFRCPTGRCILKSLFCNKIDDCGDGADEEYCDFKPNSTTTEFKSIKGADFDLSDAVKSTVNQVIEAILGTINNSSSVKKWGKEVPRTAVSLFFADPKIFARDNTTGNEITYEVAMQLISVLSLKKKITDQELAMFINALTVSCISPKAFFGVDLVAELRGRVNNRDYANPFAVLTLCNAGDTMTPDDVMKVKSAFDAHRRPLWTDIQALATMAVACIKSQNDSLVNETIINDMVKELKARQDGSGAVGNLRTTAMVLQALRSADHQLDGFNLDKAVEFVVREAASSRPTLRDMHYLLPALSSLSLANVSSHHCTTPLITAVEVLKSLRRSQEERIHVRVSMYLGNEVDLARAWQLVVPADYNLYQVLEHIGSLDPNYKVHYGVSRDGKSYVAGMSRYFDDAEDETFWFVFSKDMHTTTSPALQQKSPVDIQVKEDEELILWYRSGLWVDSKFEPRFVIPAISDATDL